MLGAWQEIDDALGTYAAEAQQEKLLETRAGQADEACRLSAHRYAIGITGYLAVLDARRTVLQARRDLLASRGRLSTRYVTINKAIGNVP